MALSVSSADITCRVMVLSAVGRHRRMMGSGASASPCCIRGRPYPGYLEASPQQCPRDGCCLVPTRDITPPCGGFRELQSHAGSPSWWDQRKSVPSRHILWRITDSLRATATMAFFPPTFLASLVPQALIDDQRETRLRMMPAASKR